MQTHLVVFENLVDVRTGETVTATLPCDEHLEGRLITDFERQYKAAEAARKTLAVIRAKE